jgi:ABC-type multidrug transport system fused ATPase/permease subunit
MQNYGSIRHLLHLWCSSLCHLLWIGRHHFAMSDHIIIVILDGTWAFIDQLGKVCGANVFDTLLRKPLINPSSSEGSKFDSIKGKIQFKNVVFTYVNNQDKPIFYFNLTI